jgi:hypothetical protein
LAAAHVDAATVMQFVRAKIHRIHWMTALHPSGRGSKRA